MQQTADNQKMRLPFTKMHGLGNDFIVFDAAGIAGQPSADDLRRLSNRRTGIGFDQALMLDGTAGAIDWAVAAANGSDSAGDDFAYSGQVSVHALGGGLDQLVVDTVCSGRGGARVLIGNQI